jgi:hypothetical protein
MGLFFVFQTLPHKSIMKGKIMRIHENGDEMTGCEK